MPDLGHLAPQPTVKIADRGEARYVTLQRPPANALSRREYEALSSAFTEPGSASVIVLRAVGRAFCSGQDRDEAAAMSPAEMARHLLEAGAAIAAVARSPIPLVCVVAGPAVGAGALLVALGDVVVMSESAWLSFPEARFGLPLGLSLLSRFVPDRLARQLMATGSRIEATRLAGLGAVDQIAKPAEVDEVADQAISALLALPGQMRAWLYDTVERPGRAQAYLDELRETVAQRSWAF